MPARSEARISVRVCPNAPKSEIAGFADGVLKVKVAAPPVKGKANLELIDLLSRKLGLDKSGIDIIKGHTSRNKVITIDGLSQEEIIQKFLGAI